MSEFEQYIVYRNIKVKEGVALGLNSKQVLYVMIGIGGTLVLWSLGTPLPMDAKLIGSVISMSTGLFVALGKVYGQDVDRYILNSIRYPVRQKKFGGVSNENTDKKTGPVIKIRYNLQQSFTV